MIAARFDQFLSRSELIYSSTSSSVCQELFSRFFNRFLGSHPICPRSSERSHILSSGFGFVNPFFHYFSFFFIFPITCVNIGITPQNVAAPPAHTAIGSRCVRKLTPKASRQKTPSFFSPHPAPRHSPASISCGYALLPNRLDMKKVRGANSPGLRSGGNGTKGQRIVSSHHLMSSTSTAPKQVTSSHGKTVSAAPTYPIV